jgi:hypothetical protein
MLKILKEKDKPSTSLLSNLKHNSHNCTVVDKKDFKPHLLEKVHAKIVVQWVTPKNNALKDQEKLVQSLQAKK